MKILFIASGNHGAVSPVVGNQAEALMSEGVEIEWYLLKGKGFKGYLRNVMPLRKYLKEHKYDAIHAHYSLSAFAASLLAWFESAISNRFRISRPLAKFSGLC